MTKAEIRESLPSYKGYIHHLAKHKNGQRFFNSGEDHARVVLSEIFNTSSDEVVIACGDFDNDVVNSEEYTNSLESFLKKEGTKLRVITTEPVKPNDEDLEVRAINIVHKFSDKAQVLTGIRFASEDEKEVHFTVADGRIYRFEDNIEKYKAYGSFNDPEMSKDLVNLFEGGWKELTNS